MFLSEFKGNWNIRESEKCGYIQLLSGKIGLCIKKINNLKNLEIGYKSVLDFFLGAQNIS